MRLPCLFTLIAAVSLSGGCLSGGSTKTEQTGVRISPTTVELLTKAPPSKEWLLAAFGGPTHTGKVIGSPNVEVWRYDFHRSMSSWGAVAFVFGGSTDRAETSTAYFELTDGVVTRAWAEDALPAMTRD